MVSLCLKNVFEQKGAERDALGVVKEQCWVQNGSKRFLTFTAVDESVETLPSPILSEALTGIS
jgi:hypothetical protein